MTSFSLKETGSGIKGPLLFVILDGVGLYRGRNEGYPGNALDLAQAPVLKNLLMNSPVKTTLKAHGKAVGLPDDSDMGNSEVGHNAIGAGRVFDQGAKLVTEALKSGDFFRSKAWMELIGTREMPGLALEPGKNRKVHFLGLLSDGNVHSHIDHLFAMLDECAEVGVKDVRVHTLLDGRDVEEKSAHIYAEKLEVRLRQCDPTGEHYIIASGGGRMKITMDRYEADWDMISLGWKTHVKGDVRSFKSIFDALWILRIESPQMIDQDIPPFVIEKDGVPVGRIENDDIVILFNFRGDRAIEISRAFTEPGLDKFARDPEVSVHFAGMMEYDGDLHIPPRYLVTPPNISRTVSEYLAQNGISQYAISETQKYGHVTYFWNGNNSEKFNADLETWVEIPSEKISFDRAPAMKAREITDTLIAALQSGKYRFLRVNYPNGDMVGHTGNLQAAVRAVESVDENLGRLLKAASNIGATVIITADHGNCDEMYQIEKSGNLKLDEYSKPVSKTSHTLNPVPFILTSGESEKFEINPDVKEPGLANLASAVLTLLGYEPPEDYLPSVIRPRQKK